MFLENMSMTGFRNLKSPSVAFGRGVNIISGANAQGKTNLLEGIYICATGRSHRTNCDKELIEFSQKEAHLKINVDNDGLKDRIDVHLRREAKKGVAVNSIPIKSFSQLYGIIYAVMFSPEDLELVKNGPSARRKFIDAELCQISRNYYDNLKKYCKVLRERNNLLKEIQKNKKLIETLFVWDEQLVKYGEYIIKSRINFIERLNEISSVIHYEISGGTENLKLQYKPSTKIENFSEMLIQNRERDLFLKSTSVGPHKDDILLFINDINARSFGSQGQQRCTALSLKISELKLINSYTGKMPLLLLDDVLSELDKKRQICLINHIEDCQTIITCTGVEDSLKHISNAKIYKVNGGILEYDF